MQKPVLFLILTFILVSSFAQTSTRSLTAKPLVPKANTLFYKLGDRVIQLKTFQYGDVKDLVYINLHDDEITAVNGARKLLERDGGLLIKIENYKTRNIKFKLEGKYYTFDPNRMFSRVGVIQTLTIHGRVSDKAVSEVEKFANRILQLIPKNPSCIIALHNNSNGKFSINSYLPGNIREKDAREIFKNPDQDPDDIYLTTDSVLFKNLATKNYNTIWQDNDNAKKDGSLSIYCGERNIRYVNCETEHGRQTQYDRMIVTAAAYIEKNNPDIIAYNYRMTASAARFSNLSANSGIMFGEKKVGSIRSITADSLKTAINGKLEMNKDFPLYSNMDFFLFQSSTASPRFELRIDPTRERKLLDPAKAVLNINIKAVN